MGTTILDDIQELQNLLTALSTDAVKADKGNKSARTRVRTGLTDLARKAQAIRRGIVPAGKLGD